MNKGLAWVGAALVYGTAKRSGKVLRYRCGGFSYDRIFCNCWRNCWKCDIPKPATSNS